MYKKVLCENVVQVEPGSIKESLLSPVEEITQAATVIQNNYRRYNARKRLKREDAIQRTTLSLENAFAKDGIQHTGEFHDCVPLPIFEFENKDFSREMNRSEENSKNREKNKNQEKNNHSEKEERQGNVEITGRRKREEIESKNTTPEKCIEGNDNSQPNGKPDNKVDESKSSSGSPKFHPMDPGMNYYLPSGQPRSPELGNIFLKHPPFNLALNPKIVPIVDFILLGKEDPMLQSSYLNFITSVEDEINPLENPETPSEKKLGVDNLSDASGESISLREPLALPGTPKGVIIEEITSLEEANFLGGSSEKDNQVSIVDEESLKGKKEDIAEKEKKRGNEMENKCNTTENRVKKGEIIQKEEVNNLRDSPDGSASPETSRISSGEDIAKKGKKGENKIENKCNSTENRVKKGEIMQKEEAKILRDSPDDSASPETSRISSGEVMKAEDSKEEENACKNREKESEISQVNLKEEFREKGTCSSKEVESSSRLEESSSSTGKENLPLNEKGSSSLTSSNFDVSSLLPDASLSTLSFSMNIDDVLGLGSEDESCKEFRKPISQIGQSSGVISSFPGHSQDSQNSNRSIERVQSPVTMMQIVPKSMEEKSKSLDCQSEGESKDENDREKKKGDTRDSKINDNEDDNIKERQFEELKEIESPKEKESDSSSGKSSKGRKKSEDK